MRAGWYEGCVRFWNSLIWAAEGMGKEQSSIRDVRHTLVAGDMKVSRKSTDQTVNQGGTADRELYSSLTEV